MALSSLHTSASRKRPQRQSGFDGEIGILELPAPPADASRCPRGDRVGREPEGDVASPHEGSVVLGPVPDAIRCRVRRMHSRLHIEIMTRRRSRWSTCRPLLAHRAESAHQRHEASRPQALQARCAHQAGHTFLPDPTVVIVGQLRVDTRRPLRAVRPPVDRMDQGREPDVLHGPCRRRPPSPRVEAAGGDAQQPAHDPDRIGGLIRFHEPEDRFVFGAVSCANQAAVKRVRPRGVQTATVKQSAAASTSQWAARHSRQVVRFLRSGAGSRPRSLRTLARGPRAT